MGIKHTSLNAQKWGKLRTKTDIEEDTGFYAETCPRLHRTNRRNDDRNLIPIDAWL